MKQLNKLILQTSTITILLSVCGLLFSLEINIVSFFDTKAVSSSVVTSVAVDNVNDLIFLGTRDGEVLEVKRDGSLIRAVITPDPDPFLRPAADRGLAVASNLDRIFSISTPFNGGERTVFRVYTRLGKFLGGFGFSVFQSFQGLSFEPKPAGGILHIICPTAHFIYSMVVSENGVVLGTDRYLAYGELIENSKPTGVVFVPEKNFYFVSTEAAKLFALLPNLRPGKVLYFGRVIGSSDLKSLGIQSVEDLAYDPFTHKLFLADPQQGKIFELSFIIDVPVVFMRGDSNNDARVNITDAVHTLLNIFDSQEDIRCSDAYDVDDSGKVEPSDAVYLLRFLFLGGPSPGSEFQSCDFDGTEDNLHCEGQPACTGEG